MTNNITQVANNLGIYETAVVSVLLQFELPPTADLHVLQDAVEEWLDKTSAERMDIESALNENSTNADVAEALDAGVQVSVVMERTGYSQGDLDELSYGEG